MRESAKTFQNGNKNKKDYKNIPKSEYQLRILLWETYDTF